MSRQPDAELLRRFADKIREYGHDLGHWTAAPWLSQQLTDIADRLDRAAVDAKAVTNGCPDHSDDPYPAGCPDCLDVAASVPPTPREP